MSNPNGPAQQLHALAAALTPTTPPDPFAPGSVLVCGPGDGTGPVVLYRRDPEGDRWHAAILDGAGMSWREVVEDISSDDMITLCLPAAVMPPGEAATQ